MMSMTHELPDYEHYDDELQSSDQTISGYNRTTCLKSTRNVPNREEIDFARMDEAQESFFPDTTDEDNCVQNHSRNRKRASHRKSHKVSNPKKPSFSPPLQRNSASFCGSRTSNAAQIVYPNKTRLHYGDIQFPNVRTILWDRRVLAGPCTIHPSDLRVRFTLSSDTMNELLQVLKKDVSCEPNGWLTGVVRTAADEVSSTVFELCWKKETTVTDWRIPVYLSKELEFISSKIYVDRIMGVDRRYKCDRETTRPKLEAHIILIRKSLQNVQVVVERFAPQIRLTFSLISSLPLLMTPLTAKLQESELLFGEEQVRTGFVTLDQARKIVPLFHLDPLVAKRPIVGIWIVGALETEGNWDHIRLHLSRNRIIYDACISFLVSPLVEERVTPSRNTFLVVIFPNQDCDRSYSKLPRFLECKYGEEWIETIDARDIKSTVAIHSATGACLAGIEGHTEEFVFDPEPIEFTSKSWVQARDELGLKTVRPNEGLIPSKENLFTIAEPAKDHCSSHKYTPDSKSDCEEKRTQAKDVRTKSEISRSKDTQNTSEYVAASDRTCCGMQKKLTMQHQEILESQQKQLHLLQDQLRELQQIVERSRTKSEESAQTSNEIAELPNPTENQSFSELSSLSISSIGQHSPPSPMACDMSLSNNHRQDVDQTVPMDGNAAATAQVLRTQHSDTSQTADMSCSHTSSASAIYPRYLDVPCNAQHIEIDEPKDNDASIIIPKIRTNVFTHSSFSDEEDDDLKQIQHKYARMFRS